MNSFPFFRFALRLLILLVTLAFSETTMAAQSNPNIQQMDAKTTKPPRLAYKNSINLGPGFYVVRLTYSPDGRYLAIGDAASSNIVIWDLKEKREQSRLHVRSNGRMPSTALHWGSGEEILWSPDNRYVTNGVGLSRHLWDEDYIRSIEFWDPMTGKVIHDLPAISVQGRTRVNRDGSKLVISSGLFKDRYPFTVFDTRSWQGKEFETNGVVIEQLAWTADDEVLVIGTAIVPGRKPIVLEDGRTIAPGTTVARTIDPAGTRASRTAVLLDPNKPGEPVYICANLLPDFLNHRAVMVGSDGSVMLLDTQSMRKLYDKRDYSMWSDGRWGAGLSVDGRYLFLLNNDKTERSASLVIETATGQQVGKFTSKNTWGLALSPDGRTLAIGRESEVLLYDL